VWWGESGDNRPRLKRFLSEVKEGAVPQTLWKHELVGHTQEAKKELIKYSAFTETENVLNSVKPVRLIQRILRIATNPANADIVLDFFAGSAVTGHAVLKQNLEDGGNRRFILVQLPEILPKAEPNLATIYDIGAARLRNVISEIAVAERGKLDGIGSSETLPTLGFRKLKLASSNFKIWDGAGNRDASELQKQLGLFAEHLLAERTNSDVLYELILKAGLPLSVKVEEAEVAGTAVYLIANGMLVICLARQLSLECLRGIAEMKPQKVICLDVAFGGNDQLKTNTLLEMKSHGIEFRTV